MADPADKNDVMTLQKDHMEIIKEAADDSYNTLNAIKDARFDINSRVQQVQLNQDDRFFQIGRDTEDLKAQVSALTIQVRDNSQLAALQTEKAVLQNTIELAKQSTYLSDKIDGDGEKTRNLINDLKTQDLNRMLIERNAEIVEERGERRHWRYAADQGQWASLQSQIQAFGSQLGQAQASMVNFGSQVGVGQRATSNNVQ